jgi:hypothetical protein
LNLLGLTRHSRQLLAESYLEAGVSDTHNLDSDPGVIFQHAADEDNDRDEDGDEDDVEDDDFAEIYRFVNSHFVFIY